jgi:hypothetical protein
MPFKTKWLRKGVEWQFIGNVTGKEFLEAKISIYGDARFDELEIQIADFLNIDQFTADEVDIKKVAYFDQAAAKSNPKVKVAILANNSDLRDYADLYAAYLSDIDWDIQIFRDRKSATNWLGQMPA